MERYFFFKYKMCQKKNLGTFFTHLVYACVSIFSFHRKNIWIGIQTRSKTTGRDAFLSLVKASV